MNETLKRKLDEASASFDFKYNGQDDAFELGAQFMHTELISVINDLMYAMEKFTTIPTSISPSVEQGMEIMRTFAREALAKAKEAVGKK